METLFNLLANLSYAQLAAVGAAIVAFIGGLESIFKSEGIVTRIFKFVWKYLVCKPSAFIFRPFRHLIEGQRRIETTLATIQASSAQRDLKIDNLEVKIESVSHEVHVNGGSSLKDTINENQKLLSKLTILIKRIARTISINDDIDLRMRFKMDADLNCTFVNKSYLETFNMQESDMENCNWQAETIHPDDLLIVIKKWEAAVKAKSKFSNIHRLFLRDKNQSRYIKCHIRAEPDLDDDGVLTGFIGTVDILEKI